MKITRFYATESGESRFVEIDIPIEQAQRDADLDRAERAARKSRAGKWAAGKLGPKKS